MDKILQIDGHHLTTENVLDVAVHGKHVSMKVQARNRVSRSRKVLEQLINSGKVMYGVNTGFGRFAEINIPREDIESLQRNIVLSHAAGVGDSLPDEIVRAVMLLKVNAMAGGYSGVRTAVIDTLINMLNKGIHPLIPSRGSVGASGDLAPLAHMTLVALGLGKARVNGRKVSGKQALKQANITPLKLQAKEGLALLNGTQVVTAVGIFGLHRAETLFRSGDVIGAMSVEALSGSIMPFDAKIHELRGQEGQKKVAENMRYLLQGSEIIAGKPVSRVQEAYSQRCIPQVHGAGKDCVKFVRSIFERELNSVTDNPLVFAASNEVLSGGNFHAEPLAMALDLLGIAISSLAGISERRIALLMDSHSSGLPGFLTAQKGLHSGFMMAQVTAAALVSENKVLAHPSSVDSIPTSANQEDYVSMGMGAAMKSLHIIGNAEMVLAIELLCSCQGVDLRSPLEVSPPLKKVHTAFRKVIPGLREDRILSGDMEMSCSFIRSGDLLKSLPKDSDIR
jgi:histidine ammonia-lyase